MTNLFAEYKEVLPNEFTEPKPILVDITNIALWTNDNKDKWNSDSFIIMPPWDRCWFEFRGGGHKKENNQYNIGVFTSIDLADDKAVHFHLFGDFVAELLENDIYIGMATCYWDRDDKDKDHYLRNPKLPPQIDSLIEYEIKKVMHAITFCHCKNVDYYEKSHPEKLQRANIKRGKKPQETYRVLDIGGLQKQAKSESSNESEEVKTALHICRGHFKTYTKENPLFGKATGTYWWPMHKRGDSKNGKVEKDYKI